MLQLVYWNIRGLAEPVRLMLEYTGAEYEKIFPARETWLDDKFKLGVEFPNLPYLVDGDVKISESMAIMKYLARKGATLAPRDEDERRRCDVADGVINDFRMDFAMVCYNPDFANLKAKYERDELPAKLKNFEAALSTRKYLAGDRLTYVDFALCESLDHHELCMPGCLDATPSVKKYKDAFDNLDRIKAFRKSDRFIRFPINGPTATWGGKAGTGF